MNCLPGTDLQSYVSYVIPQTGPECRRNQSIAVTMLAPSVETALKVKFGAIQSGAMDSVYGKLGPAETS